MRKNILERVISGFMILLMVVGIFIAVSNFTAKNSYSTNNGWDAKLECDDMKNFTGCKCNETEKVDCVIVVAPVK